MEMLQGPQKLDTYGQNDSGWQFGASFLNVALQGLGSYPVDECVQDTLTLEKKGPS